MLESVYIIERSQRTRISFSTRKGLRISVTGEGWSPLDILQHDKFTFAKTELEEQTWGKFVEPVIVSTVLGGLIYLFFSNR